jgi:hypothetical protein
MEIAREFLLAASRKHRQGSRFLGRRLVERDFVPRSRSCRFSGSYFFLLDVGIYVGNPVIG